MKDYMKKLLLAVCLFGISARADVNQSTGFNKEDLGFSAPMTYGEPPVTETRIGSIIYDLNSNSFKALYGNGSWSAFGSTITYHAPTVQRFTSGGTSGTYTTPTNPAPLYIKVTMVGGGGGGGGSGTTGISAGTDGGNSTFGGNTAGGGAKGAISTGTGGAGGTCSVVVGTPLFAVSGGSGMGSAQSIASNGAVTPSGMGGQSYFGGAGGGNYGGAGLSASANSGSGGGGGYVFNAAANTFAGGGGGAGCALQVILSSPAASYSYAVGDKGSKGTGTNGNNGNNGGDGGTGQIIVEEFYQ
jgi:hypothetical protein